VTILDSNIVIYTLTGKIAPLPAAEYGVSVITFVECLGFRGLSPQEVQEFERFFGSVEVIQTNEVICHFALDFKSRYSLRTPDAIIVASAWSAQGDLLANDVKVHRITEVSVNPVPHLNVP